MAWGKRRLRGRVPKTQRHKKKVGVQGRAVHAVDPLVAKRWDHRKTVKANYVAMGLTVDPNAPQPVAENPVEIKPAEWAGPREEYLTLAETITCRTLIMKHGSDYLKMWRDIKLNTQQLTRKQLQR